MDPAASLTQKQLLTEIHRGIVETVADRPEDSPQRRARRQVATVHTVTSFLPRDVVETMLAGHCVIFDHLFRDGARDLLRGQAEAIKPRTRGGVNATGKMFLAHLDKLQEFRARPFDQTAAGIADPNVRPAEPPPRPAEASPVPAPAPRPCPRQSRGPGAAAEVDAVARTGAGRRAAAPVRHRATAAQGCCDVETKFGLRGQRAGPGGSGASRRPVRAAGGRGKGPFRQRIAHRHRACVTCSASSACASR